MREGRPPRHRIVAPALIRSRALSLLVEAVGRGDLTEDAAPVTKAQGVVPLAPLDALGAAGS